MPLKLDSISMQKLTHESAEIRLRTLDQIIGKLNRAFEHNELIQFKPGELCKQLIRWFGCEPLQASDRALQLLLLVLRSSYGDQAINQLGVERFKREVEKVKLRLKRHTSTTELQLVNEIKEVLSEYQQRENANEVIDVIEIFDSLSVIDSETGDDGGGDVGDGLQIRCPPTDYEPAWSKPTTADFTILKRIADVLAKTDAGSLEMKNAVQHLQITMEDYPAEYLLQAPHIFLNLIYLYDTLDEDGQRSGLEYVACTIIAYLQQLRERLKMRRNVHAYAVDVNNEQMLANTQLKISKAVQLVLEKSVRLLESLIPEFHKETRQIVEIVNSCIDLYRMQDLSISSEILQKLHKIIVGLRKCFEQDEHFTLKRIKYLLIVCLLDEMLLHNGGKQSYEEIQLLEPLLRDYTFKSNFPHRYKNIEERVLQYVANGSTRYQNLRRYEDSFQAATSLLQCHNAIDSNILIMRGGDICMALDHLKSVTLTERLFSAIIDCNIKYNTNSSLRIEANKLLLNLLSLKHEPLRSYTYKMLALAVKRHFACLMDCERYCSGLTHAQLLEAQILGVPLSSELLLQLVRECGEGSNEHIRQYCEDILALMLKSQQLLGENWIKLLELLLPVLPLLQCCTNSPQIMELLQKLYHPDTLQLPFLSALQGNIVFMFHGDSTVRSEALTRLIYMMNSVPDANNYMPNLLYISDVIPNDLCIVKMVREYQHIFTDVVMFNERETLHNLLNLLETPDIEPMIRKTTLMQLNVMCQQWHGAAVFCEESANYLILQVLESSMQAASYENYMGSVVPAIGILCKVLLYDSALRHEISETPNIYVLLLRALCLYHNDIQLRQDVCICLFVLLYANFIVVLGSKHIQAPRLLDNLRLPLNCEFQSFETGQRHLDKYEEPFACKAEEMSYLRQLLAASFYKKQMPVPKKYLEEQKSYDFDVGMQLTLRDWRLMKATTPIENLRRFLCSIFNATEHRALINASVSLQLQLLVRDQQSVAGASLMPDTFAEDLYNHIGKYLQLPPGNGNDYALFEELLELCDLCARLPILAFSVRLVKDLIADFQHAVIALLKNPDTSLRLHCKLCISLGRILSVVGGSDGATDIDLRIFRSNIFELLYQMVTLHFPKRDLLRIRCILSLQKTISAYDMGISDEQLLSYYKRYIKLSLLLKSFTQTGTQWQRDCLTIVCQLCTNMEESQHHFKLNESTLKYLSGVCGHCDHQVRALAWCIITYASRYDDHHREISSSKSGLVRLEQALSYLPGGFMACCLSTSLDVGETIVVRQLAANLFTSFLCDDKKYEEAYLLFKRHSFFARANEAIRGFCVFEHQLPADFDHASGISVTSCDLIGSFCRICARMLQIKNEFISELCETDFMNRLYELLKQPMVHANSAYQIMCADICQLYGACYPLNFPFLQRTLCRDYVWLTQFYQLLGQPHATEPVIVNVLQLLLVLCKDDIAYEKLCEKIAQTPELLFKVLLRAFTIERLDTPLQCCALAVLSLLLIRAQKKSLNPDKEPNFVTVLEDSIDPIAYTATKCDANATVKKPNQSRDKDIAAKYVSEKYCSTTSESSNDTMPTAVTTSAAAVIFVNLFRIFLHLYPLTACKFDTAPAKAQLQVSETLAVLLRFSPAARSAARGLKFFDKIAQIFNAFFDQFNCPVTTYVRRYGENKKMASVKNLQTLLNIHVHWFVAPDAALTDILQANALSKLIIQLWPWLMHSGELKVLALQVCSYHSEHSLVVCQQFSALIAGHAHSLLQLIIKMVSAETTKVKASNTETFPVISTGLRGIMNCCACIEGRLTIAKAHTLDVFDSLYPFHLKSPKVKTEILHSWLVFWELFSRYPEGAQTRNLRALCELITRYPNGSTIRLLTLRILRNMCFLPNNRPSLMASTEFIHMMDAIVSQPLDSAAKETLEQQSYEEQLLVCVGIWKLIATGAKYVAMLRSTNLAKRLRALREHLATQEQRQPTVYSQLPFADDLAYVLDVILHIFND